jgi:hypothetical protein
MSKWQLILQRILKNWRLSNMLAENRLTMSLFDIQLFTKHIETAYTAMYERYQMGMPPDHLVVAKSIRA